MVLFGTIVNGLAIVMGAWLGVKIKGFSASMQETVMKAIGLAVIVLGFTMALEGQQFLIVILSLAIGAVIGERFQLEGKLNHVGAMMENRMKKYGGDGRFAEGFVAATLLFVVGAMAIIGALDSGFRQDHSVLLTKSMLDGFSSIVFAAAMGIGVMFSAIPVVLYQGSIALMATWIIQIIPEALLDAMIAEITAVGGIMIMAIGLNLLGIEKIRVANLLPGIVIAVLFVMMIEWWPL
ncbi:DUF554 domain-containing protein [Salisediminibacterium selenitireducens]|uniref:Transport protein n=1 Tax=Bacillus selenitireducens (strain ATCC 700615 / DSM 15326 / MLS10) TaxID=439292 RepID=D6Y1K9_BACIE|nr:DUF554 domain-containing protein [Salisediminibacterium selenitireducens]ADI00796.1 protein of unknown function DUF554 [[Bacillus] selenitireducens MLS10]